VRGWRQIAYALAATTLRGTNCGGELGRQASVADVQRKDITLWVLLALFLTLSVVSMLREQEVATIGFLIAGGAILVCLFPGMIKSVRFGSVELIVQQAEQTVAEARVLAKTVAEVALPLVHHTEGWYETSSSTVQIKDAVIERVLRMKDNFGIQIADDILEMHYVSTCCDYSIFIPGCLTESEQSAYRNKLGPTLIPARIEDVHPPQAVEDSLRSLGFWDDYVSMLVEDYRHYYKHRAHRSEARWKDRSRWKRPSRNGD
jgi:hypothetical protein